MAVGWAAVIYSIVIVVTLFAQGAPSATLWVGTIARLPEFLLTTAAWVTGIFVVLEYAVTRKGFEIKGIAAPSQNWSPGTLPPIGSRGANGKKPRSYAQAVAEVVFGILFLGWLLLVPTHPYLIMGPGAYLLRESPFTISPALIQVFWCVAAVNVFQLTWKIVDLARGNWRIRSRVQHVVLSLLGMIPLGVLLSVPDHKWVLLRHPELDHLKYGATADVINGGIYKVVLLIAAIVVVELLWEIGRRSLDGYRKRVAAM
jgi:hypothetical protein